MRNNINPNQISLFNSLEDRGVFERERVIRQLCHNTYDDIISIENLLISWREFLRGKRKRKDVAEFSLYFTDNIFELHNKLAEKIYRHGGYKAFKINDPKPRDIHKANVCDRLLHYAIYRILYPYFDKKFIFDSYSCRINKGTHKAINRFRNFGRKISKNNTRTCWILKCDVKKFFASIDHKILKEILAKNIVDENILWLLSQVIDSFHTEGKSGVGLPLGNLTSQLLVNIYMNEFDYFMKCGLKTRYYIRYADDFVIFSNNKDYLEKLIANIAEFLETKLRLFLHPDKVFIKTLTSGVDFLGCVNFSHHRVLRTKTKKRILKKILKNKEDFKLGLISKEFFNQSLNSYLGVLKHCSGYKIEKKIKSIL